MKRLLIGYDGSPCAQAAVEDLAYAGLPEEMEVLVVSVADVWVPSDLEGIGVLPNVNEPEAVRKAQRQALEMVSVRRKVAEELCSDLKKRHPKWNPTAWVCADSPAWAIVEKARSWKADLVVVGSHGRSLLERFFLGSVAQKVAAEAPCSVRIARDRKRKGDKLRIVAAVDGSKESEAAVNSIASRRWPAGTEVEVVAAIDPKLETSVAWPSVFADRWVMGKDLDTKEWVCRMAEHAAGILRKAGLKSEIRICEGEPKEVILREADVCGVDNLFIGARGLHHGNRLYLGTTASAVAARAHCSVEIVRL